MREYIKLRRLAYAAGRLADSGNHIIDIAVECGFGGRETFSRAFKEVYGLSPSEYRSRPVTLDNFDKPNLLLNYVMVDEGVPLITEGIVLEYSRKCLDRPVHFLGVEGIWRFEQGKMLGERPAVSEPAIIWDKFHKIRGEIPCMPDGRLIGVSYRGDAPDGYSTYFVGAEVEADVADSGLHFASWALPAREYVVCHYEAENHGQLMVSLGKMMKFTRLWLRNHGLRAGWFYPEIYYNSRPKAPHAYMEMWIPFKKRENSE